MQDTNLGNLLNLCVTVAAFPLHFSHEYSTSSICGNKYGEGSGTLLTRCTTSNPILIAFVVMNQPTHTLKKRSSESWMDLRGRVFFRRGRLIDRSLNRSRFWTTSPHLQMCHASLGRLQHYSTATHSLLEINNTNLQPLWQITAASYSPFTCDCVLHLKLHVDHHRAGVDTRGVCLLAQACTLRLVMWRWFIFPAFVHFLHILLQLVQTLAQELMGILPGPNIHFHPGQLVYWYRKGPDIYRWTL